MSKLKYALHGLGNGRGANQGSGRDRFFERSLIAGDERGGYSESGGYT